MEKLLTVTEVAKVLQLTPAMVRRKLRKDDIKGTKVGRLWRVKEESLKEYLGED